MIWIAAALQGAEGVEARGLAGAAVATKLAGAVVATRLAGAAVATRLAGAEREVVQAAKEWEPAQPFLVQVRRTAHRI